MALRRPNTFLIGAPKRGTTSMAAYLARHSQVFFSDPTELNYFCTDFSERCSIFSEGEYLRYVSGAGPSHRVVAGGSIHYLRSASAVRSLARFSPGAKCIVMLRDCFGNQLARACDFIPRHDLITVRFEDGTDTRGVFEAVCDFLGIGAPPVDMEFSIVNRSESYRSKLVVTVRALGRRLLTSVVEWNCGAPTSPEVDPGLEADFRATLEPEVELLEEVTGWDLGAWRPPRPTGDVETGAAGGGGCPLREARW